MKFHYNDGGREEAGFKGKTGDCVIRAIAIATNKPYQEVYNTLFQLNENYALSHRDKVAKKLKSGSKTPRNGNFDKVYKPYLESELGWKWTPTMFVGQGCKVHLDENELPSGIIICKLSKHLACVIDGVLNDTYDCTRDGSRCVYGYWSKPNRSFKGKALSVEEAFRRAGIIK